MPVPTMLLLSALNAAVSADPTQIQRLSGAARQVLINPVKIDVGQEVVSPAQAPSTRSAKARFAPLQPEQRSRRAPRDDEDVTLDNGRKMKYGDFKKLYARLEASLNDQGFSLSEPGKTFTIRSATGSVSVLNQQNAALLAELTPAPFVAPRILVNKGQAVGAVGSGRQIGSVGNSSTFSPSNINITKTFDKTLGTDQCSLRLEGVLILSGNVTPNAPPAALKIVDIDSTFNLFGKGIATGKLLGKSFELARMQGLYHTDKKTDTVSLQGFLFVGGQQVWTDNRKLAGAERHGNFTQQRSVQAGGKATLPIFGPFSVSGEFGIRGTAGIKATYDLAGSSVNGEVNPFADVDGFAEGAVGIGLGPFDIVDVGVYADLTFAKVDMKLGGSAGVGVQGKDVVVFDHAYFHNDLDILSGEIGAFIRTPGIPFILDSRTYKTDLFHFDGFKTSGYLIDHTDSVTIGQVSG